MDKATIYTAGMNSDSYILYVIGSILDIIFTPIYIIAGLLGWNLIMGGGGR